MKTKTVVVRRFPIKLEQFLKFAGACASGGEAKARILQRQVRLNGSVCTQRGKKIQPLSLIHI